MTKSRFLPRAWCVLCTALVLAMAAASAGAQASGAVARRTQPWDPVVIEKLGTELASHPAAHPEIRVTSALKGSGIAELRAAIAALAAPAPPR